MREIKFRVWNKFERKMYKVGEIKWNCFLENTNISVFIHDSLLCGYTKKHSSEECDTAALELMQYTGLKDKNGKEIYEGDIVEFYEVGRMWKAKIGYDSGAFTVDFGGSFTFLCGCYTEDSLFEVIGNIYDNKELL